MDPMTYGVEAHSLRQDDLLGPGGGASDLVETVRAYALSGHAGCATVFCYSLRPASRTRFLDDMREAFGRDGAGLLVGFVETVRRGGNKDVGAVITNVDGLVALIHECLGVSDSSSPFDNPFC